VKISFDFPQQGVSFVRFRFGETDPSLDSALISAASRELPVVLQHCGEMTVAQLGAIRDTLSVIRTEIRPDLFFCFFGDPNEITKKFIESVLSFE